MKKNIIKCLSFICVAIVAVTCTYKVLAWKDTSGSYTSVTEQLYNTKKNMIDVAFVGSSHVYTSIYPAYLWKNYGISAFDMSLSEQDKFTSYYCLKELLKTQRPKAVCLEMYGLTLDGHEEIGNEYRNMLAIKSSLNAYNLAKNGYSTRSTVDYLLRWPIIHTRYKELDRYDFAPNPINSYSRGAVMGWGKREAGYMSPDVIGIKDEVSLSQENKDWLDSFLNLSKQYDFELILFLAPDFQSAEQRLVSNGAKTYAKENGLEFFDFTEIASEINFDPASDMGDLLHCNADGALKISTYFADYFANKMDFVDHRGDDRYYQWDKDYNLFEQTVKNNEIYLAAEDEDYLDVLSSSNNFTIILSLDGDYENCIDLMLKFGIGREECLGGGKWIFRNGQAQKIMGNNPGEVHIYDINRYDSVKLQCMPEGADMRSNILFGLDQQISVTDGLNVFVYDEINEKPVSKRGMSY